MSLIRSAASFSVMTGCMVSSWMCFLPGVTGIRPAHRDQVHAEVAYLDQDPVQGGLIGQRARNHCLGVLGADLEALEPGGPAFAQDALDPDLVML
jgi:hypothetical protein